MQGGTLTIYLVMRGTKAKPGYSTSSKLVSDFLIKSQIEEPMGVTILPPVFNCSCQAEGSFAAEAEAKILSNGAYF